jgi:hypothetical protein
MKIFNVGGYRHLAAMSVVTEFDGSESVRDQIEDKYGQYDPDVPDESPGAYPITTAGCMS